LIALCSAAWYALQVGEQRDQAEVGDEERDADHALDDHEPPGVDADEVGDQRRRDLEERDREADRDREREDQRAARELGRGLLVLGRVLVLRRVVGADREGAEADRERLAERNDPAHDREPEQPVLGHRGLDRALHLGDRAVRLANGDRPGGRAPHHHALEDGLSSDR
jgi:hypothetical protein